MIPSGDRVTIPAGTVGYITQALGGSFTVFVDGNLFRVAGVDADAIGKQPVMPPSLPENATDDDVENLLWDQMKTVYDPEIPVNIVDLGLVYRCEMGRNEAGEFEVEVRLTSPDGVVLDLAVQRHEWVEAYATLLVFGDPGDLELEVKIQPSDAPLPEFFGCSRRPSRPW